MLSNSDFADMVTTVRSSKPASLSAPREPDPKPKRVRTKAEIERRKEKRETYLEFKKERDDQEKELSEKYRDRAKERRNQKEEDPNTLTATDRRNERTIAHLQATARAAASAVKARMPVSQKQILGAKRKLLIEESKYLGGDIEHTHLVKGLDYALLEKKRGEIRNEEKMKEEAEMERLVSRQNLMSRIKEATKCQSAYAKRILDAATSTAFEGKNLPKINKLYLPGRMAFVFDITKRGPELPVTITRSEIEVSTTDRQAAEQILQQKANESTNDIVLNKLIQILSYIRSGDRQKLERKRKSVDDRGSNRDPSTPSRSTISDTSSERSMSRRKDKSSLASRSRDDRRDRDRRHRDRRRDDSPDEREKRELERQRRDQERRNRHKHQEREIKYTRTEASPKKKPEPIDEDDDDIFAGVGSNYKPDLSKPKKTSQKVAENGKIFQAQDDDIENTLPVAPKKMAKMSTTEDIIEQAKQMAKAKKAGVDPDALDTTTESKFAIPDGAVGFGKVASAGYGWEIDDDDRFDDQAFDVKKGGRMNHKSLANQQWQKVSGMLDKRKKDQPKKK